jgi:hypothetical protein
VDRVSGQRKRKQQAPRPYHARDPDHTNSSGKVDVRLNEKILMERIIHGTPRTESTGLVTNSVSYKEFLAEHEEILCHKWIESEKVGYDIGFERALVDWIMKYRSAWREKRHRSYRHPPEL